MARAPITARHEGCARWVWSRAEFDARLGGALAKRQPWPLKNPVRAVSVLARFAGGRSRLGRWPALRADLVWASGAFFPVDGALARREPGFHAKSVSAWVPVRAAGTPFLGADVRRVIEALGLRHWGSPSRDIAGRGLCRPCGKARHIRVRFPCGSGRACRRCGFRW